MNTTSLPRFTRRERFTFNVIRTDCNLNSKHHGLRTNTSEFVGRFGVGAGDQVVYTLPCDVRSHLELRDVTASDGGVDQEWVLIGVEAEITLESEVIPRERPATGGGTCWVDSVALSFGSHPGRACSLGEDGLETSFGNPILGKLFVEHLGRRLGIMSISRDWVYAPIDVSESEDPDATSTIRVTIAFEESGNGWRNYQSHTVSELSR